MNQLSLCRKHYLETLLYELIALVPTVVVQFN